MSSPPRAARSFLLRAGASIALALVATATPARAEPASPTPKPPRQGVAVVGGPGVKDEAFALARAVYATHLRPRRLDEAKARALAGDPPAEASPKDTRELGELRAAVTGEDVASRTVLASIAERTGAAALVVVLRAPAPPEAAGVAPGILARLFLAETGELDAATYAPDPAPAGPPALPVWRGTVTSLERLFPAPAPVAAAPPSAPAAEAQPFRPEPRKTEEPRPFYASPWLWGSLVGAALVGGLIFVASRDTTSDPIRLQMQVPR